MPKKTTGSSSEASTGLSIISGLGRIVMILLETYKPILSVPFQVPPATAIIPLPPSGMAPIA